MSLVLAVQSARFKKTKQAKEQNRTRRRKKECVCVCVWGGGGTNDGNSLDFLILSSTVELTSGKKNSATKSEVTGDKFRRLRRPVRNDFTRGTAINVDGWSDRNRVHHPRDGGVLHGPALSPAHRRLLQRRHYTGLRGAASGTYVAHRSCEFNSLKTPPF